MDNVNGSVDTQEQIQPQVQTQSQEASAEALQNIQEGSANNKNNNKTKNSDMILGKFKSVEDLTAAYKNMELQQLLHNYHQFYYLFLHSIHSSCI